MATIKCFDVKGQCGYWYTRRTGQHDITVISAQAHQFATWEEAQAEVAKLRQNASFQGLRLTVEDLTADRAAL